MGGTVELKFKRCYKLQMPVQQTTFGNFRTELFHTQMMMNRDLFDILKLNSLLEQLPETLRELWNQTMVEPEEAMDTEVITAEEAAQEIIEVEARESTMIVI